MTGLRNCKIMGGVKTLKNKRFYTLFKLENGDEIPLSFRQEKELTKFMNEHKGYVLLKKSNKRIYFESANSPENRSDLERLLALFSKYYSEEGDLSAT